MRLFKTLIIDAVNELVEGWGDVCAECRKR